MITLARPLHPASRTPPAGITLVELVVVLAIVAVLAAIALPMYTEHVRRGHRADARAALLAAAQWMEKAATATGRYPPQADFPAALAALPSGRYQIALASPAGGVAADSGRTFTLTAVPAGAQRGDRCGSLTLTHQGARSVLNARETAQTCWSR